MSTSRQLIEIEEAFRRTEDALRRRDPDTLAGRMPKQNSEATKRPTSEGGSSLPRKVKGGPGPR